MVEANMALQDEMYHSKLKETHSSKKQPTQQGRDGNTTKATSLLFPSYRRGKVHSK